MVSSGEPHYLATANVDFLVQAQQDVELHRILAEAEMVVCDGTPLVWASRFLGNALPERVAGSDLVPLLIQAAARKRHRLFFLGATPESTRQAVERLRAQFPDLLIAGHYSPPFSPLLEMDHEAIKARIRAAKPDLLFVAFGCPKQEKWIAMHYRSLGVPVTAGVGATIDFLAGHVKRAPLWMQRCGAEWLFRLGQEPRRLFRRYVKDLGVFSFGIVAQWLRLQLPALRQKARARRSRQAQQSRATSIYLHPSAPHRLPAQFDRAAVDQDPSLAQPGCADGPRCILDLSAVEFIDSTGIALLVRWQKQAREAGRRLVLLGPSRPVCAALKLMHLEHFFLTAASFSEAEQLLQAHARNRALSVTFGNGSGANRPLAWHGEVTAENADAVWESTRQHVSALTSSGDWLLDLSDVRFIDSTGLALLLRAKKLAEQNEINLAFTGFQPPVRNVLQMAQLEPLFLKAS